jgi:hypothetical protein
VNEIPVPYGIVHGLKSAQEALRRATQLVFHTVARSVAVEIDVARDNVN